MLVTHYDALRDSHGKEMGTAEMNNSGTSTYMFGLIKDGFDTEVIVHVESDSYFDTALTAHMVALIP